MFLICKTPVTLSLLSREKGMILDPAWSADQKFIFYASRATQISIFKNNLSSGKKSLVLKEGGINLSASADDQHLAFVAGDTHSNLKVLNLKSNSLIYVSRGLKIDVSPAWLNELLFFARYSADTNLDGQLTIDDNPDIWKLDFKSGRVENLRQLTGSSSYGPPPTGCQRYTSICVTSKRVR